MIWDDSGYLISKNKYNENSLIVELYTKDHGKVSGIVFGGTSKKIKNYLQIGNKLFANYNSKNENRIGYFKFEIINASSPYFFDNKEKLNCLISAMQLVKILTAEAQKNLDVFNLVENFFELLQSDNWIQKYIYWELELFSKLGYNLELDKLVKKEINNNKIEYLTTSSIEKRKIPNFLIEKNIIAENKDLLAGLKLVGDFLEKSILKPNNLSFPKNRVSFINSIQ
ncbi:DNA repair protein RecO [Candidatus Pelagibacter sp.]|uniref:DNA repair protein RecO n=1 Tax=Candidatus Pelagibacter sp. TaxID=2024849 RepID=UPI003F83819F